MQEKIHGLVLRTVRFSDTQQVVDVFTREHGLQSFVVTFASLRHRGMGAMWQPLNFVEMEVSQYTERRNRLPHPREVCTYIIYTDLPYNPIKTTVALFLAEFLQNVLRAEQCEEALYQYLEHSLQWFDAARTGYANFHLCFLLHLMRFVGIQPSMEETGCYFDLRAGTFTSMLPRHPEFLRVREAQYIRTLMRMDFANMSHFHFSRAQRQRVIEVIQTYYRLHLSPFPELRSLEVLRAVFD